MPDRTGQFYAAEESIHGYGSQLMVGDNGSPEAYEAIAGLRIITPGTMDTADIDNTHLRSPDAHREHRPGIRNSGPFSFEGIWMPNEQSQSNEGGGTGAFANGGLIAMWRSREIRNFKIVTSDGSPDIEFGPFRGYISQFQPGAIGLDDIVTFTGAVQPTAAYDATLP